MMSRGVMLRALAADSCLTRAMVQSTPLVRSGDAVTVVARSAGVEVSARMVAASSGDLGAVIRVVNQQSRRAVSARVVAAGVVETIHD
jgi:flagella basal body P-ring formation protein FlgA